MRSGNMHTICQANKPYLISVLNSHSLGFHPKTQKLELPCTA